MLERKDVTTKLTVLQRSQASWRKVHSVMRELAILVKEYEACGHKDYLNAARHEINLKYGHDWRTRGDIINGDNQWTDEELEGHVFPTY